MGESYEFAVIKVVHVQICAMKQGGKSACVKDLCYYIRLCVQYCQSLTDWKELEEIPQRFKGWKKNLGERLRLKPNISLRINLT